MLTRERVAAGFVGEVMGVHVSPLPDGVLSRPSYQTWQRDVDLGANTLTIAAGHAVDAMRFVVGDVGRLSAVVATEARQLDTGTLALLDVTAPDNVLLSGALASGAIPFAGSFYRMEFYGHDGTLVASGEDAPQLGTVAPHGARRDNTLLPMPVPQRLAFAAHGTPPGEATNVGQMYALFAQAIRDGQSLQPTFGPRSRCTA